MRVPVFCRRPEPTEAERVSEPYRFLFPTFCVCALVLPFRKGLCAVFARLIPVGGAACVRTGRERGRRPEEKDRGGKRGFCSRLGYAEGWMGLERFCCDLSLTAKKAIFVTHCGYGVIGSRARLRIWCREACRFESYHPHNPYNKFQKTNN